MTTPEFIQLKAFARIDGAMLSVLWVFSFVFYVLGLASPLLGLAALLLAAATPVFVGLRLKHFRDQGLDGTISLMRGWAYAVHVFFYGSLLFALAVWAYFTFMDQGYLIAAISRLMALPENVEALRLMGLEPQMEQGLETLAAMRPIDLSLNMLTTNLLIGAVVALPIAALLQRKGGNNITMNS